MSRATNNIVIVAALGGGFWVGVSPTSVFAATIVKASNGPATPEKIGPAKLSRYRGGEDSERDAKADERRDEAILELNNIIPTFDDGPQKADLLYRLAELYWEKSRYSYFQEFKAYDAAVEKWTAAGSTKANEPKLENQKSEDFKKQALGVYDQILSKYPDYVRTDEVMFNKANSLYDSDDKNAAIDLYFQLVKRFPQSDFVPDTYLELGEHYFNANDLQKAITAYQKAVQSNKPRIYSFALYKLAWCAYNAQDYASAIDKFKKVVEYAEQQQAKRQKDHVLLRQEALRDMLLSFSQIDAIDEAKDYYATKLDTNQLADTMAQLAGFYEDQGKYDLEVRTLKLVVNTWPNAPKAPKYQAMIVHSYSQQAKRDKVKEEARRLITTYQTKSPWADAQGGNKDALAESAALSEQALRELATGYHAEAQKTKDDKTYLLARDLYKEYLDAFPTADAAYKMRFNYAEILYREKEYDAAAEQYDLVVAADAKGQFLKLAAFASVLANEQLVDGDQGGGKNAKLHDMGGIGTGSIGKLESGRDYSEQPIPEPEQRLAAACERFVKVLPNDADVVKVKFKEARIYFIHHHFDQAAERLDEIIDRWPTDKLAKTAARLVLQGFNARSDWPKLNQSARQLHANKDLVRDADFAKETEELIEGSAFKQVQAKEAAGQLADAGRGYRAFVDEFPKSKFAETALYDAMVISDKAGQLDVAISSAEKMLKDYPDAKNRETTTFLSASFQERSGDFDRALKAYQSYVDKYPKGGHAQDAIFNIALFQDALGNSKAAITAYEKYLKEYPKAKDALTINLKMATVYERSSDWKKEIDQLKNTEKRFPLSPSRQFDEHDKLAKAYRALKKDHEANVELKWLVDRYAHLSNDDRQNETVIQTTAAARFELYEPTYQSYLAIKLALPEKKMSESLVKKAKLLGELEKEYARILAIGSGDYGIAALTHLGLAYQDLSKALTDAPVPPHLSDEQKEIYLSELQNRALPIEEKAIEAYEKAVEKADELHIYNRSTLRAEEQLSQLKPSEFPEVHKFAVAAPDAFASVGAP